jgi:hypothetical protein
MVSYRSVRHNYSVLHMFHLEARQTGWLEMFWWCLRRLSQPDVIAKLTSSGAFSSVTGENILFLRVFVYYASVVCLRTEILW